MPPIQIARFIVAFSWLYHGIFPKLIHIAPLEQLMTASIGFSDQTSYWLTKFAGVGEVIFGVLFFILYRNLWLNLANIAGLTGLLGFVAFYQPQLLIEAFNPVTTNIALIGFSLILLHELKQGNQLAKP
ncbi:DoxX-like family protein [Endozoicomonas sp. G2_1]|uniref:DoxX-like family protein n=1 Tax=Endozoicomonas sp. G2_1 TaxID=2821091 RepID=UPI001AD999BB|nr:DoxX-like family protein [Endozoicomonas sp. G2_1]MBO9489887.1 DoxX-like family protein [Endozoicomonas sp. G2_1]